VVFSVLFRVTGGSDVMGRVAEVRKGGGGGEWGSTLKCG